jgi:phospholipid/cholesterol/gamma-HCH transport system permease protein
MIRGLAAAVGRTGLSMLSSVGAMTLTFWRTQRFLFPPRFDRDEMWRQLYKVGVASLPIVMMTALLVGVIMVIQSVVYVNKTGATSFVGSVAGVAVLSELGPALIGLMFSGRVGANATAELGTMVVSEQVDALRALAIDPVKFIVVPRFIAIVVSLVMLTLVGDLFGLVGGVLTSQLMLHIEWWAFVKAMLETGLLDDLVVGLIKAVCFGTVISTVSTTYGLNVTGGAKGVGKAVNGCVVATALGIFTFDYVITYLWYLWEG